MRKPATITVAAVSILLFAAWTTSTAQDATAPQGVSDAAVIVPDTSAPAPVEAPPVPALSLAQQNAVRSAESYLESMPFSRAGLIRQLSSEWEGYSVDDATFAVDSLNVDWMQQAVLQAQSYLELMPFSRDGLIHQLESEAEGFTHEQAVHGADATGL